MRSGRIWARSKSCGKRKFELDDSPTSERYAEEEWIRFQQAARENQRKWARSQDPGQCLFCTDIPRDTRPRKIALHTVRSEPLSRIDEDVYYKVSSGDGRHQAERDR